MNLKEMIEKVEEKLKNDDAFKASLVKEPVKTLENLLGIDIPEDTLKDIMDAVKDKLEGNTVSGIIKEAEEKIGGAEKILEGLFHKKN
ncbi:MAG: hypothetical protein Q4D16_24895 [Eubacteriales bacterium]|nr:hypothetical protein [Eubacteriales bacterium]